MKRVMLILLALILFCGCAGAESYENQLEEAKKSMKGQEPDKGLAALEELVKDNPEEVNGYVELYNHYTTVNDYYRVSELLKEIIRLDPSNDIITKLNGASYGKDANSSDSSKEGIVINDVVYYVDDDGIRIIENNEISEPVVGGEGAGILADAQKSGNWIYYISDLNDDEAMYIKVDFFKSIVRRYNVVTGLHEIVASNIERLHSFAIVFDKMYYSKADGIYSNNLEGTNELKLIDINIEELEARTYFYENKIMVKGLRQLYLYDIDGTNKQLVFDIAKDFDSGEGRIELRSAILKDDYVYFTLEDYRDVENSKLHHYATNINDLNRVNIASYAASDFWGHSYILVPMEILDDYIFISFDDKEHYEVSVDGITRKNHSIYGMDTTILFSTGDKVYCVTNDYDDRKYFSYDYNTGDIVYLTKK